jgi:hypothetical protein
MKIVRFIGVVTSIAAFLMMLIFGFEKNNISKQLLFAQEDTGAYESPYQGPGKCHLKCQKPAG